MILREICVDRIDAAIAAADAGVERIEFCSRLDLDGLTPKDSDLRTVVDAVNVPVFAMIRPRSGHFVLAAAELREMLQSIAAARENGAQGFVLGALESDGNIDEAALEQLIRAAQDQPVTFHRAFDGIQQPVRALETLIDHGVARLLTAGGTGNAWEGRELLKQLVCQAGDRCRIMPGGGVRSEHVRELLSFTGALEIHSSVLLDLGFAQQ